MKRSIYDLNKEYVRKRPKRDRDELLENMKDWCLSKGVQLSQKVKFGKGCAGHGLIATENIVDGEELAKIPRSATLHHSSRLTKGLKYNSKVQKHPWLPVILSLMAEWDQQDSPWREYIQWLPDVGSLTLPHIWGSEYNCIISNIGLKEHIDDDRERMDDDFKMAWAFIEKNKEHFPYELEEAKILYYHCAFLMMSYSFTDPEEEEESDENAIIFAEEQKSEPKKFMLPVGDLLNHTWDNNARIEFDDEYLTINATKAINAGCEIFNTFGNMSNSRLLHMYGFAEESNPYDDAHLSYEVIIKSIREHPIEAVDAKIKLMDSLGFFNEIRIDHENELDDQFRALLAVISMERKDFNKLVKETKKKSNNGQIEELELELESNSIDNLNETERNVFQAILSNMRGQLKALTLENTEYRSFLDFIIKGSLSVLEKHLK